MQQIEVCESAVAPRMVKKKISILQFLFFLLQGFLFWFSCSDLAVAPASSLPSDGVALLAFGSKADVNKKLGFSMNSSLHFCHWRGVACIQLKVVRLVLRGLDLGGVFPPDSLTRLDQLRVLSLKNNSLTGTIPDLSRLFNLKSLFLDWNFFTGSFPPSVQSLRRLRTVDLSHNNLTGLLPSWLIKLDRIYFLSLEWNFFNGSVPAFNQSSLQTFNVSGNDLTGAIPVTVTLRRFGPTSFLHNPGLCGEVIHKECHPGQPFFRPATSQLAYPPSPVVLGQSAEVHGVELTEPPQKKPKRTAEIIGFSSGAFVLLLSLLCFFTAVRKQRNRKGSKAIMASDAAAAAEAAAVMRIEEDNELEEKVKRVQGMQMGKSGNLVFCAGDAQLYSLDQLMRASAELLGRGTIGTTYKAVLDSRLIVSVKRLDSTKMAGTSKDMFERQMEAVGGLRHPNLVPLRAYFQAKEERLLIYDYHPNGSLFSLVHGTKSTRAKPLHWTSCLKIAEDVAQGLSYIHQAWRLVHGNLKSSNVLLGADFEACITDYCLSSLTTHLPNEDNSKSNAYKAPETRVGQTTSKSDVYSFGVLLIELLTGKAPSEHPFSDPNEIANWVRSTREDEGEDERRMALLVEVATACRSWSSEQRPTMWQVLKMLQEIKESVLMEDGEEEEEEDVGTKSELL